MPLTGRRIAFIGAGNMGEALIRGLLHAHVVPATHIMGTGRRPERLERLHDKYGIATGTDNRAACSDADVVILAVKPQIMERILKEIASSMQAKSLVISVAAGISSQFIESKISEHGGPAISIVRAMPNTPAIVGAGATAISGGPNVSDAELAQARTIFESVGTVSEVDEALMDAVTGLSGSGPAYVMMIIEALSDAGVKVGLPRYQAQHLAAQTVLGSAKLLIETGEHPGVLKDRVTSPGGTAISGLHTLEEGGLRTTLINAVIAATERSRELGDPDGKK